jgi:hypothetical protein
MKVFRIYVLGDCGRGGCGFDRDLGMGVFGMGRSGPMRTAAGDAGGASRV